MRSVACVGCGAAMPHPVGTPPRCAACMPRRKIEDIIDERLRAKFPAEATPLLPAFRPRRRTDGGRKRR